MGLDNLACRQPEGLPDDILEMKDPVSPLAISKPHIDHGGHCQTLDDTNVRTHNIYPHILRFSGAHGFQSEV